MFAIKYETYEAWLGAHPEVTAYRQRIVRMHKKYPNASLAQLGGHPGKGEEPIYWIMPRKASQKALTEFKRLAEKYAELAKCFEYDEVGQKITWQRSEDEPCWDEGDN